MRLKVFVMVTLIYVVQCAYAKSSFPDIVEEVTQRVGAIALFTPLESSVPKIIGTGFAVENGKYVITNYHVVDIALDPTIVQYFVFMSGKGQVVKQIRAEVKHIDPLHDLALLQLAEPVKALEMLPGEMLRPGTEIAFTGFPIGAVLGLYPATHKGLIAAVTPDVIPVESTSSLTMEMLKRKGHVQTLYQLDATAYPGNSGSPVYLPETGEVIGIINKVIVKDTKESALSAPSGISYAVPVKYINKLLAKG